MSESEASTRTNRIDPQLEKANWNLHDRTQVRFEVPVDGYDAEPWNGVTDYCLYNPSGDVIAVIEAKRTSRSAREGEEQLRYYVEEIGKRQSFIPFGFMSNGHDIYFWEVGAGNPRLVAGFFTPDDLRRLQFIRKNQKPLASIPINNAIVDRTYQHEAIRRTTEAFSQGRRRALIVMATGTGKTRVAMAITDLFLRAYQAQHVLFIADRDPLVEQAMTDGFKAHLPNEPRDRVYTDNIDTTKRLFVATLQTMGRCFGKFSPGFFDLIIFDEAHRSIFNRFNEVIEYFDARMIGLTATPAHFIDRDTFRVFDCKNTTPTFLYTYERAVKEEQLVDFSLYQAQTGFQRRGIKGADLTEEERNALIEQGIDPDLIDYSGTDLEILVSNQDTLRKQWEEIMDVCIKDRSGQLPGKTIVFAMTKKHAERIRDTFEKMYPQHIGVIQTIYHGMERVHDGTYGDGLITKFKKNDLPRIAISVDMLDTGVDIPEVVNLVFMKPVQSQIKLWQMIGRGTRNDAVCRFRDRLPNGRKTEFKIIDFWQNDFARQSEDRPSVQVPVLVTIFNTRLQLLENNLGDQQSVTFRQALSDLRTMIARIPVETFSIKKIWGDVEAAWKDPFWEYITVDKVSFLSLKVGPLLRFVPNVDIAAETFTSKLERLKLQIQSGKPSADLLISIAEDVSLLPEFVLKNPTKETSVKLCLSQDLAVATAEKLHMVINDLAAEMRHRRERPSIFLKLDLPDFIATRGYITIGDRGKQVFVEEYRKRVESRIIEVAEKHPTLRAVLQGEKPTLSELADLERTLNEELGEGDLHVTRNNIMKAYGKSFGEPENGPKQFDFLGFLWYILELENMPDYYAVVDQAFQEHIISHNYTGDQIRFLRSVQEIFLQKRKLAEADLYEPPLTIFGRNAVERFFTPPQIRELIAMTEQLAA
jgi:type I restriction enzyme R subunit